MTTPDLDLLRRFSEQNSEEAFAEIVHRHLDLVHSAALRQVRSLQLAQEVAQSVFTDLSRNVSKLKPDTILTAWLYQVTRRTAIDVVRREARRQLREQAATEMNTLNATAADWTHIEPLLDKAMHALDETDRTAVLLRYFENKSLREVGATLGTSDDAAQKRVSRAVERLREFFAKRGVTVGANGLVAVTTNAIQAGPVGLAFTISTAALAGTTIAAGATATTIKTIAMTTFQKTLISATLVAAVGTGIYEARRASTLRSRIQTLQQQQGSLAEQLDQLRTENERLAKLKAGTYDSEQTRSEHAELLRLRSQVGLMRQQIQELSSPQAQSKTGKVDSDEIAKKLLEETKLKAEITAAEERFKRALDRYHTGQATTDEVTSARVDLFALKRASTQSDPNSAEDLRQIVQDEIKVVEAQIKDLTKRVEVGAENSASGQLERLKNDLERLSGELAKAQ